jgi:hypothetical protein
VKPAAGPVATYLDFGLTQGGRRVSYDYYEGQHAYELFMGARYLHDLMAYRTGNLDAVHHPEDLRDNLRKYVALAVCAPHSPRLTYYEVGSSVFGAIDAINYLNARYAQLNTAEIAWLGVDNSTFMNNMARYTHEGYDLTLWERTAARPCDLFFAKGVSLLYAIDDEELFCDVLTESRIAVFDYTFSRGAKISDVVGTGLPVTFLSLDRCRDGLRRDGKRLLLEPFTLKIYHQSPLKATYDCVYGDEDVVADYLAALDQRVQSFEGDWNRPLLRLRDSIAT